MATKKKMLQAAAGFGGDVGDWDLSYAYYNASNGWDLSNVNYNNALFAISAQESAPRGVFFKPDGTKMYITGSSGDDVNEYDLSTAWEVSTASYLQAFSVASEDVAPEALFFKPDGTKMYVLGGAGDDINEYDLSTAWDISTSVFFETFSVVSGDTQPTGLFFKPDGSKMYIIGKAGDDVSEYDLSPAWDVSTASLLQNFSVSAEESSPEALFFKPDGTKMFVVGGAGQDINEYSLSTAWDISTASYVTRFSVGTQNTTPKSVFFDPSGSLMYVLGATSVATIFQYSIGGFKIDFETTPQDLFFKPDGTKMYVLGSSQDAVREYDLSTAWDTSSASFNQSFSVAGKELTPRAISFKPDGTKMYIAGTTGDDVNEYDLSTAWDVSTSTYVQRFSVSAQEVTPEGLFFKPDGTKMYIIGYTDFVHEYNLSTAWDVSSASYLQEFDIDDQETAPTDLFFKPDGTKMYVLGSFGDDINEYELSTPWDILSASYVQVFSVVAQLDFPTGLFFREDGTQMFVVGSRKDRVFTYSLGERP